VNVRFAGVDLAGGSITYASAVPLTTNSIAFTVLVAGQISFENVAAPGDNVGLILDNVRLESVPEPGSLLLLGGSLAALAYRRRRI
jgi:PEP-CTERM motif